MPKRSSRANAALLRVVRWTLRVVRWTLFVAAVALVALTIFDGPIGNGMVRVLLGLLGLGLALGYWYVGRAIRSLKDYRPDSERDREELIPPAALVAAQQRVAQKYTAEEIDFLEEFLVNPETYVARVIEEVEVKDPSLSISVLLNLNVPELDGKKDTVARLVPLARIRKGVMLDTLEIQDSTGKALSPLAHLETKALLMLLVRQLFVRTFTFAEQRMVHKEDEWVKEVIEARDLALELVSADLSRNTLANAAGLKEELKDAAAAWRDSGKGNTVNTALLRRLQGVCEFFETHFVLVVETEVKSRTMLQYTRDLPLFMQTSHVSDSFRALLGLRPSRFTVPLSWPFLAGSYHFRISGEASLHISDHSLIRLDTKEPVTQASLRDGLTEQGDVKYQMRGDARYKMSPYVQIREKSALPHGHVYIRNFCCLKPFGTATVIAFEEVPPGVLGGAAVVSILNTALVLFFTGIGMDRGFSSGLPAFLLALPAFAASWLGYSSDNYRILRTTLTARLGLIGVGVVSIAGALLFLGQSLKLQPLSETTFRFSLFGNALRLHDVSLWWLCLAIFSLCLTVLLSQALVQKAMSYFRSLKSLSNVEKVHREWTIGGSQ